METERRCPFYGSLKNLSTGYGRGYCEFDCTHSACEGEIEHCGKLNVLKRYLMERSWMKATIERRKTARN
jgi:hypothetical protein